MVSTALSVVSGLLRRLTYTGDVVWKERLGRLRTTTVAEDRFICLQVLWHHTATTRGVLRDLLRTTGTLIGGPTVQNRLH